MGTSKSTPAPGLVSTQAEPGRQVWLLRLRQASKAITITLLAAAAVAFIAFGPGAQLFGFETRAVISGSMAPAIPEGSAVFVQTEFDTESLEVGDIALFSVPGQDRQVMHRIVATSADGGTTRFITRGDANAEVDPGHVEAHQVVGLVQAHIPWLGGAVLVARSREGAALALAVPALAIVLFELRFWYLFVRYGRSFFESDEACGDQRAWTAAQAPAPAETGANP